MTTIACNLAEIAADSCFSYELAGSGAFPTDKLYRIGKSIFGEAGQSASARLIDWLQRGRPRGDRPEFSEEERDEFVVMELAPDGIFIWDANLFRNPVRQPFMAIGSGRKVALYCMQELGMSPARAVEETCKVCDFTRPPVTVMKLAAMRPASLRVRSKRR